MRKYRNIKLVFTAHCALALACVSLGASETISPQLKAIPAGKGWKGATSLAKLVEQDGEAAIEVTGHGVIWLDGFAFENGSIEFDARGKSAPPQSNFMGIAFRVVDEKTYDTVYFRPFNFRAENPVNRSHAVQYASEPDWPWRRLRSDRVGQYEKPLELPPDGDAWFHARVVIEKPKVRVFVNGADKPSLVVDELTERKSGSVGLFFDGYGVIANLKITPLP